MVQTWSTIYAESFPYIRVLIHLDYWYLIKDSNAGSFSCFLIISATKSLTLHMNKLENPFLKIFCAKFGWNRSGGFVEVGSIYKSTDRQMGTQTDGLTDTDRLKDKKMSLSLLSLTFLWYDWRLAEHEVSFPWLTLRAEFLAAMLDSDALFPKTCCVPEFWFCITEKDKNYFFFRYINQFFVQFCTL